MAGEINMSNNTQSSKQLVNGKRANSLDGGEWLRHSFSIWRNLGKSGEERQLKHPALFTVKLVSRILNAYSTCEGKVILDPFAGSGTTLIAALEKNMTVVGLDINERFRQVFTNRISLLSPSTSWEYHLCDARHINKVVAPQSVDICITSPPYWDILNRKRTASNGDPRSYSSMKNDMGNIESYDEFLASLSQVIGEVYQTLKPGGIFVLNVMDLRKKSTFYPLHMDVSKNAMNIGFMLDDIIIWDRQDEYNNMRTLGYPYKFIINKVHEYLLVFRK